MNPAIVEPSGQLTWRRSGWLPSGLHAIVPMTQDDDTQRIKIEAALAYRLMTGHQFPTRCLRTLNDDASIAGDYADIPAYNICENRVHDRHGYQRKVDFNDQGEITTPISYSRADGKQKVLEPWAQDLPAGAAVLADR